MSFSRRSSISNLPSLGVAAVALSAACGGGESVVGTDEGMTPAETSTSEPSGDAPGTPEFDLVEIYRAPEQFFCFRDDCRPGLAVDLEFNPARPEELWVLYRQPYDGTPCTSSDRSSCNALRSQVAILTGVEDGDPSVDVLEDGNSLHFMRLATALAFAGDDTFATVGEARTGNFMDEGSPDFMGPTWWSSNPEIFAQDFDLNGSHLDMLHGTPYGMGIAHEPTRWGADGSEGERPVFWAFNGQVGAIDRYDFNEPHEPGGSDHSDGTLHRYVQGELVRAPGIPSHMEFANLGEVPEREGLFGPVELDDGMQQDWWLYIADTGQRRIVRLDTKSGRMGGAIATPDPQLADPRAVDDAVLEEVIPPGTLRAPSGLAIDGQRLIVTDAATSLIHVFDLEGEELEVYDTGLPEWSLSGVTVGPDGRTYFVDWEAGRVLRLEPR